MRKKLSRSISKIFGRKSGYNNVKMGWAIGKEVDTGWAMSRFTLWPSTRAVKKISWKNKLITHKAYKHVSTYSFAVHLGTGVRNKT